MHIFGDHLFGSAGVRAPDPAVGGPQVCMEPPNLAIYSVYLHVWLFVSETQAPGYKKNDGATASEQDPDIWVVGPWAPNIVEPFCVADLLPLLMRSLQQGQRHT